MAALPTPEWITLTLCSSFEVDSRMGDTVQIRDNDSTCERIYGTMSNATETSTVGNKLVNSSYKLRHTNSLVPPQSISLA